MTIYRVVEQLRELLPRPVRNPVYAAGLPVWTGELFPTKDWWPKKNKKDAKKEPALAQLLDKLQKIAPNTWVVHNPALMFDPQLPLVAREGKRWKTGSLKYEQGKPNSCHWNAAGLCRDDKRLKLVTGYALSSNGTWHQHTWAVNDKGIVETTYKYAAYFGVELTGAQRKAFFKLLGMRDR